MKNSQQGAYIRQPVKTAWDLLMYHPGSPLEDIFDLQDILFTAHKALGSHGDSPLDALEIERIARVLEYSFRKSEAIADKMNVWGGGILLRPGEVRIFVERDQRVFVVK